MKTRVISVCTALLFLLVPLCVFAKDVISDPVIGSDEVMHLGHYDSVTNTHTTETVTVSELKAQNEAVKVQRGLSDRDILAGHNPMTGNAVSMGGGLEPQSLIGDYTQSRVNVGSYPYSAVLLIWASVDKNEDGVVDTWITGSGFMVGSKVMVTAAHNFFYTCNDGRIVPITECRIYPNQASAAISADRDDYYHPKSWTYSTVYTESGNVEHDWIVVTLFSALGDTNGFLAVRDPASSLSGVTATVSGYPAETPSKRYFQYKSTGPLKSYTTKRLFYLMDTEKGNSGGPIFILGNQVIGIHTRGSASQNSGTRIFDGLYSIIENRNLAA